MKVGFVSLGCSKNLVDTEMMIGLFKNRKYEIVNNPKEAEIIVINTCGFIEKAKEEAINTILEMAKYKNHRIGKCRILIATGCLVERYKDELEKLLPEVDIFLKYSDYAENKENSAQLFDEVFSKIENKKVNDISNLSFQNRVITTGKQYAYVRIAEGCDNRCTYCAIPYIRGKFVSRKIEDIKNEVENLIKSGIKEIILIAQDTSKYGIDIYGEPRLAMLLKELSKISGLKWIRFLYTYPETITDELIDVVKNNDKICKYFDIPIQHISNSILKKMNRKSTSNTIRETIKKLRTEIPGVVIRTTVMVGFPGETKDDFEELYDFVKQEKFDKLGAFMYSKEDGTPAARMKEQIHHMTKRYRYNKIMQLQQQISKEVRKNYIGKKLEVIVEEESKEYFIGRSYIEVPDIDGLVYIEKSDKIKVGQYIECQVTDTNDYDMFAVAI